MAEATRRSHDAGDEPVVSAVRAGRIRDAVGLCAREHGAPVGRFCMALLGSQAEAEEAAQETLLASAAALPNFRGECSVRGFLFGIARNVCAKRLATRSRRDRRLALVHDAEGPEGPHDLAVRRAEAHRVRVALEALRPSEREALLLRYEAEVSYAEMGMVLGIDEAAARQRTGRALARLREVYGKDGTP